MDFSRQVPRLLHEEHAATISLLDRLEGVLAKAGPKTPADTSDNDIHRLLGELAANLENETGRHFDFEEGHLFARLNEMGDGFIAELLTEEHNAIRPLADTLAAMARTARSDGFSVEAWRDFHQYGMELVERQVAHIQKEEMGLLPILEDLLDDDVDADLATEYAMAG